MSECITDRSWFKANRNLNYRLRDPLPGEVAELSAGMLRRGTAWDVEFHLPPEATASVLVIRPGNSAKPTRILTLGADEKSGFALLPVVAFNGRLAAIN